MFLTEVIARLREACPVFDRRVAGTQSFTAATREDVTLDVPCAFVVPLYDTAAGRDNTNSQKFTEAFSVIVVADNSVDKRQGAGMAAEIVLGRAKKELLRALLMWTPVTHPSMDGLQYTRGQHLYMDNARIYHDYRFSGTYYFRSEPTDDPLWVQIEKLIDPYFPDIDPRKLRKVLVPDHPGKGGDPVPEEYHEILSILNPVDPPVWIRRKKYLDSRSPEFVMNGDPDRVALPPDVARPDQLK